MILAADDLVAGSATFRAEVESIADRALRRFLWLLESVVGPSGPADEGIVNGLVALCRAVRRSGIDLDLVRGVLERRSVDLDAPPAVRGACLGALWQLGHFDQPPVSSRGETAKAPGDPSTVTSRGETAKAPGDPSTVTSRGETAKAPGDPSTVSSRGETAQGVRTGCRWDGPGGCRPATSPAPPATRRLPQRPVRHGEDARRHRRPACRRHRRVGRRLVRRRIPGPATPAPPGVRLVPAPERSRIGDRVAALRGLAHHPPDRQTERRPADGRRRRCARSAVETS